MGMRMDYSQLAHCLSRCIHHTTTIFLDKVRRDMQVYLKHGTQNR